MADFLWSLVARVLRRPLIVAWLTRRAWANMDAPIVKGDNTYMLRGWVFNPYDRETRARKYPRIPFSLRMHFILREDDDRHLHDHPWSGRSLVLDGGYYEQRWGSAWVEARMAGSSARLEHGQFHRIVSVSSRGALTLCVLGRMHGDWGFLVDGKKVPHAEYLKEHP